MLITPLTARHLTSKCHFPPLLEPARNLQLDEVTTMTHTDKTPKALGWVKHKALSLQFYLCKRDLFILTRHWELQCAVATIGAPHLQRLNQVPVDTRGSCRRGELAGKARVCGTLLEAWLLSSLEDKCNKFNVQEILKGLFQTQLIQVQMQTSFCLPFQLPKPFAAPPPCLSEDFRRTEKETIKFWSEELFKY